MSIKFELDPTQEQAINFALDGKFSIISGGAGTGKTTIIEHIANRLENRRILCAFTGKAASRLKEATGMETSTIHSALQSNGISFTRQSLEGFAVVVDEASMVSSDIMAEIIKRKPAKLILVGDEAQLPPVGRGQPFHDLIKARPDSVYNLTKCFRNTEAVFKAATAIRNGQKPELFEKSDSETWEIVRSGVPEETQRQVLQLIIAGKIDFQQDIILCPRNGDNDQQPCTVKGLNKAIVDIVNPRDDDEEKLKAGDRVINTKNYADHDVWNGTTGTIHSMNRDEIFVKLDTPIIDWDNSPGPDGEHVYKDIVKFTREMKKTLELAYALSVHKSQGSQYRKVIFCALECDSFNLLGRALIYTAITRTKEHCMVFGQVRALYNGILKIDQKRTVLQEIMKEAK